MMTEILFCAAIPVIQMAALVVVGLIFRVDRKDGGR